MDNPVLHARLCLKIAVCVPRSALWRQLGFQVIGKTPVTAPILFTVVSLVVFPAAGSLVGELNFHGFLSLAKIGLLLLLFTDVSRTDLKLLNIRQLPAHLLSAGILLTILLGALAAKWVFPSLSWWEAGIIASILAPTDAGLGQVIVDSPRVPKRVREALNVEAGPQRRLGRALFPVFHGDGDEWGKGDAVSQFFRSSTRVGLGGRGGG